MKKLAYFFLIIITLSCNPVGQRDLYESGTILINSKIVNPKTNYQLGDSVEFQFQIPDTIDFNGTKKVITIANSDGAELGFSPCKIIPSLPGGFSNAPNQNTCNTYTPLGNYTFTQVLQFKTLNNKLVGRFYIIPQQKGVYFFEQTQLGYADLNNKSIKARININFGNINRNHQMLIDSAGASNNFGLFLQGKQGLEVYGFKVN